MLDALVRFSTNVFKSIDIFLFFMMGISFIIWRTFSLCASEFMK